MLTDINFAVGNLQLSVIILQLPVPQLILTTTPLRVMRRLGNPDSGLQRTFESEIDQHGDESQLKRTAMSQRDLGDRSESC